MDKNSKISLKDSILEKIVTINSEIDYKKSLIKKMRKLFDGYQQIMKIDDRKLRLNSTNDEYYNSNNWDKTKLSKVKDQNLKYLMAHEKDHLRKIDDPLINGLIELEDNNYSVFAFGESPDKKLLSKILNRKMDMKEYLKYLHGELPVTVTRDDRKHFIKNSEPYSRAIDKHRKFYENSEDEIDYFEREIGYEKLLVLSIENDFTKYQLALSEMDLNDGKLSEKKYNSNFKKINRLISRKRKPKLNLETVNNIEDFNSILK